MTAWESIANELFSGVMGMGDISVWMMFLIGGLLIYLGVKKDYEPMLLSPWGWAVFWPISPAILR